MMISFGSRSALPPSPALGATDRGWESAGRPETAVGILLIPKAQVSTPCARTPCAITTVRQTADQDQVLTTFVAGQRPCLPLA